jgi:large subunit ribosomal protein L13
VWDRIFLRISPSFVLGCQVVETNVGVMNVQKTYYPKLENIESEWILVDANEQLLGRVAAQIARLLLGKHKPGFTPGVPMGDFVVVVNAECIRVTGKKMDDKFYARHSGYPGGIKITTLRQQLSIHPDRVIRSAVWGMLPHNKTGRELIKRLKIYTGPQHPHSAQAPKPLA